MSASVNSKWYWNPKSRFLNRNAWLRHLTGTDVKTQQPGRTLAAVIPHGTQTWFFTLKGSPNVVAAQKSEFDGFIRSLRFKPDQHAPPEEAHPQLAVAD